MTDLGPYLERLGLEQYLDAFVGEGFDCWETLVDIQERDFDYLNVKLGHRRKLQRAIAEYRGISYERLVGASPLEEPSDSSRIHDGSQTNLATVGGTAAPPETKRKYRRHPKPDENAPERPPSAYVIFSNKVREEVRGDNLSFTEIAKLVGDKWQKLSGEEKEPYESQANSAKERYNIQLSTYKKTDAYKEYMQYLAEFKAKHGTQSEPKRPRLEPESSGGSLSNKSLENPGDMLAPIQGNHGRGGSIGSVASSAYSAAGPPSAGLSAPLLPTPMFSANTSFPTRLGPMTNVRGESPPTLHHHRETRRIGQLSAQSSMSDEFSISRGDSETLMRAAGLSLNTPPSGTPPIPALLPMGSVSEFGATPDALIRSRQIQTTHNPGPSATTASYAQSVYTSIGPESPWRVRPPEYRGYADTSRILQPPMHFGGSSSHGAVPLPPLIHSERPPDFPQGSASRTLPLPRVSPTSQTPVRVPESTAGGTDPNRRHLQSTASPPVSLERSESDAANALAGLATGSSRNTRSPSHPGTHAGDKNR